MDGPLTDLKHRAAENWLVGHDSQMFFQLSEQLFLDLIERVNGGTPPKILLREQDPIRFLAGFIAACAAGCDIFLCNPNWVEREWQQVFDLIRPDLVLGDLLGNSPPNSLKTGENKGLQIADCRQKRTTDQRQQIMIPTGGSSGKIRFAIHTWETLMAAVRGFYGYFGKKPINSFCVLPLYHVSGLMQFLRSLTTGGRLVILPFNTLVEGKGRDIDPTQFFISLVPTQLARLLTLDATAWLSRFQTVLLGGAPAWVELLEQARRDKIPLAPTYGMTETASQIVTLKPEAFLAGNNSSGQVLPHAQVTVQSATGEILGANQTGIITIQADSLTLGYYPNGEIHELKSDDLGFFDEQGYLTIVGRSSTKIVTGGENVFPTEVEAVIRATQLVADVCVIGLPDHYWGQVVTAIYVPSALNVSSALLRSQVDAKLCKFKRPKHWIALDRLPRNAQGKVNCEKLKRVAIDALQAGLAIA